VGSVLSEDLVTLKEIAARTRRPYESVRLLAAGKRGPGGFPGPMSSHGWALYSWTQVSEWLTRHYPSTVQDRELLTLSLEHDCIIAAADHLVRARALMRGNDLGAAWSSSRRRRPVARCAGRATQARTAADEPISVTLRRARVTAV